MISVLLRLSSIPVFVQKLSIILICRCSCIAVSEQLATSSANIKQSISGMLLLMKMPRPPFSLRSVHKSLIKRENITGLLMSPCLVPIVHGKKSVSPCSVLTHDLSFE